jgi:parallel beta-helix repeat protein
VYSTNFVFRDNTIDHTNNTAITLENEFAGALISHNSISNSGTNDGMGGTGAGNYGTLFGIQVFAAGAIIEYNYIHNTGYDGINFHENNVIVRNNFIDSACTMKCDGGGIYTQDPFTGQQILNNIVVNCVGTLDGTDGDQGVPVVHGIYLDDPSTNVTGTGNTCAGNSYSGIYFHSSNNTNFQNNTCYNNGKYQILVTSYGATPTRTTTIKHNILFGRTSTQISGEWETLGNDINQFGSSTTIDSNYILRPINDNLSVHTWINSFGTEVYLSLAGWVTYSGFDSHSIKSPKAITSTSELRFEYNATSSAVTIPLAYNYEDARSVQYNGAITLQPYTSAVLIQNGAIRLF